MTNRPRTIENNLTQHSTGKPRALKGGANNGEKNMKTETIILTKYDLKKLSIVEIDFSNYNKIIAKHAKRAPEGCFYGVRKFKNGNIHLNLVW